MSAKEIEVEISCCLCEATHKQNIQLPDGWETRYPGIDEGKGFCPKHSIIAEWAANQCPGCVGGWGDCGLWSAFAYESARSRTLTDSDFAQIAKGICPKRTNGTFVFSSKEGMERIDLSEPADTESGIAFVQAIKDYWAKYPARPSRR